MRKLKKLVSIGILLFGVSLILLNCQKDEVQFETQKESKYHFKKLSLNEILKKTETKNSIHKIEKYFDINSSENTNRDNIEVSNFIIETESIVQVLTDSTETYSFRIITPTDSSSTFENFVIDIRNNQFLYFIAKYEFDANNTTQLPYSVSFQNISDDQIDIGDFQEYFAPEMPEGDCFQIFFPGQGGCDCDCDFCAVVIECPQTGGDTDGDSNNGIDGTSGDPDANSGMDGDNINSTGGGDSNSYNPNNPSPTGVNQPIPYENQILDCLGLPEVNSTDFDYGMWLNNADFDDVRAIATFLNSPSDPNNPLASDSNCDDPIAQEFAIAAMEALQNEQIPNFDSDSFIVGIAKDSTFVNTELDCIYEKLKGNYSDTNFFKDMLSEFEGSANGSHLTFSIGTTPGGGTGFTKSESIDFNGNTYNYYEIISSQDTEDSSNLNKMVNLSHELMHAYMFVSLESWGIIEFDPSNGAPYVVNPTNLCQNVTIVPNIDLTTLTIKERWTYFICEMYFANANSITYSWSHSLFNTPVFTVETYREKLEQLLLETHEWDDEPQATRDYMIQIFGLNDWKQKVAEYMSWTGLDGTPEFSTWLATQNSYTSTLIPTTNDLFYEAVTKWWVEPNQISEVLSNCN
jgi:hypothetical protein